MKNKLLSNNDFKLVKSLHLKKYRDEHGLFLIEGRHLVEEFLKSGISLSKIKFALATRDFGDEKLTEKIKEKTYILNESDFGKLSETKSPQGIMLVAEKFSRSPELGSLIVALDNINDPGNLGTIMRNAYWFNVSEIIIGINSADLFNSKTIRASQGAVFHTAFRTNICLNKELNKLADNGYKIFLATLDGKSLNSIEIKPGQKYVLVFGNEANGINQEIAADNNFDKARIDGYSSCDSLNVAVSSGILLYHFRNCI